MIAILVTLLLAAGTLLGWYTHRAWLRIDAWGRNMNDCDAIFRLTGEVGSEGELQCIRVLTFDKPSPVQPLSSRPIL